MRTPIRILMALVTVATLAVALPAAAAATSPVLLAPRGNSGVTQYAEVVPTDQGATPPRAGGAAVSSPVTLAQQRRFDRLGADGRTLAAVTKATAPPPFSASTKASAAGSGPVTLAQQRRFDRLGADGRTLAAVTKATAPPPFSASTKASAPSSVAAAAIPPRELNAAGVRSAFASIVDAALGPGGGALGAIVLLSAVALVARGVRRRGTNP